MSLQVSKHLLGQIIYKVCKSLIYLSKKYKIVYFIYYEDNSMFLKKLDNTNNNLKTTYSCIPFIIPNDHNLHYKHFHGHILHYSLLTCIWNTHDFFFLVANVSKYSDKRFSILDHLVRNLICRIFRNIINIFCIFFALKEKTLEPSSCRKRCLWR